MSFLTRYDGELREPLVWRQESQVSMHVPPGSTAQSETYLPKEETLVPFTPSSSSKAELALRPDHLAADVGVMGHCS